MKLLILSVLAIIKYNEALHFSKRKKISEDTGDKNKYVV